MRLPLILLAVLAVLLPSSGSLATDAKQISADEQVLQRAGVPTDGSGLLGFFRQRTLKDGNAPCIAELVRQAGR